MRFKVRYSAKGKWNHCSVIDWGLWGGGINRPLCLILASDSFTVLSASFPYLLSLCGASQLLIGSCPRTKSFNWAPAPCLWLLISTTRTVASWSFPPVLWTRSSGFRFSVPIAKPVRSFPIGLIYFSAKFWTHDLSTRKWFLAGDVFVPRRKMWLTQVVAEEINDISKLPFRLCYLLPIVPLGIHSASPFSNRILSLEYLYRQNSMISPFTKLPNVHIPSRHELSDYSSEITYSWCMVSMKIMNSIDRISLQFETWASLHGSMRQTQKPAYARPQETAAMAHASFFQ